MGSTTTTIIGVRGSLHGFQVSPRQYVGPSLTVIVTGVKCLLLWFQVSPVYWVGSIGSSIYRLEPELKGRRTGATGKSEGTLLHLLGYPRSRSHCLLVPVSFRVLFVLPDRDLFSVRWGGDGTRTTTSNPPVVHLSTDREREVAVHEECRDEGHWVGSICVT